MHIITQFVICAFGSHNIFSAIVDNLNKRSGSSDMPLRVGDFIRGFDH